MEIAAIGLILQSAIRLGAAQYPNLTVTMAASGIGAPHQHFPVLVYCAVLWRFPLRHVFSCSPPPESQVSSLPYFYEGLETPVSDEHFWDQLQEIWQFVHNDLMDVRFESEHAAMDKVFNDSRDPNNLRLDSLGVARYRDTDDRDNLTHFHGMSLEALGETQAAITSRQMSAHFMRQWSILLSCHGYVAAAMMARGTDVQGKRAGRAGAKAVTVEAQKRWFSHYYLRERSHYPSRRETELAVWRLINAIVEGSIEVGAEFEVHWFEKCLNLEGNSKTNEHFGQLTFAFRQNRLSEKRMKFLVQEPANDLPPLNLKVPRP